MVDKYKHDGDPNATNGKGMSKSELWKSRKRVGMFYSMQIQDRGTHGDSHETHEAQKRQVGISVVKHDDDDNDINDGS